MESQIVCTLPLCLYSISDAWTVFLGGGLYLFFEVGFLVVVNMAKPSLHI